MNVLTNFRAMCALVLLTLSFAANAQSPDYRFIKKIPLEGNGKWDYLKMDGERERLFVSHGDQVHVIDLIRNSLITGYYKQEDQAFFNKIFICTV